MSSSSSKFMSKSNSTSTSKIKNDSNTTLASNLNCKKIYQYEYLSSPMASQNKESDKDKYQQENVDINRCDTCHTCKEKRERIETQNQNLNQDLIKQNQTQK